MLLSEAFSKWKKKHIKQYLVIKTLETKDHFSNLLALDYFNECHK